MKYEDKVSDRKVRRGQVWWWVAPEQDRLHIQLGVRPVVIVSNDHCNEASDVVTVVPFTTKIKKPYPQQVPVVFNENVSIALADQLTSIPLSELSTYICDLADFQMDQIDTAIAVQLGLVDLKDRPYAPSFKSTRS